MKQTADGDQFDELVREAKKENKKLFSNCYLFSDELDGLARSGRLWYQAADGALLFFLDEGTYYHLYVYMDERREFPRLRPEGNRCTESSEPASGNGCAESSEPASGNGCAESSEPAPGNGYAESSEPAPGNGNVEFPGLHPGKAVVLEYSRRAGKAGLQAEAARERLEEAGFVLKKVSRKLQISLQTTGGKGNLPAARAEEIPAAALEWKEQALKALRRTEEQGFSVRTAEQCHLGQINALWDEVSDPYDFVCGDRELPGQISDGMVQIVLSPEGDVAAAALMKIKNGVCSVWHVAVKPCFRQRGLAKALLVRCMEEGRRRQARTAMVWVDQKNTAANRLYESLGFAPDGKTSVQMVLPGVNCNGFHVG